MAHPMMDQKIVEMRPVQAVRQTRKDVFYNPFTAYGTSRDHGQQYKWKAQGSRLSWHERSDIYCSHEIAWKIINLLPDNALRKGVLFPDLTPKQNKKLTRFVNKTKFYKALKGGLHEARLHCGAILYAPITDGNSDEEELDVESITAIGEFRVFTSYYVFPVNVVDGTEHPIGLSGEFTHYKINDSLGFLPLVHKSRVIRLPGAEVDQLARLQNNGWDGSYLDRNLDPLVGYASAHGMIPNILKDIVRDIIQMQGLNELSTVTSTEDQALFESRIAIMMDGQSMLNKTVIDGGDTITRQTTATTGIPDMVKTSERRLSASSQLPLTILLGEAPPSGIGNGAGTSQKNDFNESTEDYQTDVLKEIFDDFYMWCEAPTKIDDIDYVFAPLTTPTAAEWSKILKETAEAVSKLKEKNIITALEAATPFAGSVVNPNVTLDLESREMLQNRSMELLEDMLDTPEVPTDGNDGMDQFESDENQNNLENGDQENEQTQNTGTRSGKSDPKSRGKGPAGSDQSGAGRASASKRRTPGRKRSV